MTAQEFRQRQLPGGRRGYLKYNGLNTGVQKRYRSGLQYQANYTWSHFLDNQSSRSELAGYPGANVFTDFYNRESR